MPSSSRVSLPGVTIETTVETPSYQTNRLCRGILYCIHAVISCICFWVFFVVVLFCCLPCICFCGLPNLGQRPNFDEAMLAALADVESRRQRDEDEVKSHLFSQKVEDATAAANLVNFISSPERNTNGNVLIDSWNSAISSVRSFGKKASCAICLEEYEAGDVLSWSKRDQCTHVFHEECIVKWLSMHDDCPLCRSVIIGDDSENPPVDEMEDEPTTTVNDGNSRDDRVVSYGTDSGESISVGSIPRSESEPGMDSIP